MFKSKTVAAKLIILTLLLSACANNEKSAESAQTQDPSLYSMESSDSGSVKNEDILFDDSPAPVSKDENASVEPVATEEKVVENESSEPMSMESAAPISPDKMSVYRVQHDRETLMMIAFKIYGDYHRWREIAQLNKEMFDERFVIKKGMMLKFALPDSEFKYEPKGEPFIIKWGDTLSSISKEVYDTLNRWKEIWHNNRPLIRNPDKIFAGFTIYYVPGSKPMRKKEKEVLPDLASTNPNAVEETATTDTPVAVDPKIELEQIETAGPAKTDVPVESDSQASSAPAEATIEGSESSDRNPTSL